MSNLLEIVRVVAQIAVPIVIFVAGRQIARAQFMKSVQDAWNEYNKLVVANKENLKVAHANFSFSIPGEDEESFRKAHIAFVALNALMTVHYGTKHGLLSSDYHNQNFHDLLRPFMADKQIYDLVQNRGYPQEFKDLCTELLPRTPSGGSDGEIAEK